MFAWKGLVLISGGCKVDGLHASINLVGSGALPSSVQSPDNDDTTNRSADSNKHGDGNRTVLGSVLTLSGCGLERSLLCGAGGRYGGDVPDNAG